MSDSFADLWNSSVPQKKQESLSSLAQQSTQQRRQQGPDLFALLASSSTSSLTSSNNPTPPPPPPQTQPQPQQRQQQSHKDAFSDLFSTSSSSDRNLTIAQRAALADKQRQESSLARQRQHEEESSAWAGLDSLGGGFSGLTPTTVPSTSTSKPNRGLVDDDDWGLGGFGKPTLPSSQDKPKPKSTAKDEDGWGLEDPAPSRVESTPTNKSGASLWDLDEFSLPSTTAGVSSGQHPKPRVDSPSNDFDFGNREDGLLNGNDYQSRKDGDEDFMSVFNKPPQTKPTLPPRPTGRHRATSSSSPKPSNTRRGSPPPHVLGQIVEMGFSVPKAKEALAANNNDVQAALDQLLASEGGHDGGRGTPAPAPPSQSQPGIPRRRDREILRDRRADTSSPASNAGSGDLQAQAEQILAQAGEIGRGMFNKASLFWKEKKEQVQKAVEEHRSSSSASGGNGAGGRPRWMQESGDEEHEEYRPRKGGFRDDGPSNGFRDGESEPEVRIPRRVDRQRERERVREQEPVSTPPVSEPEVDLFAPSEPTSQPQLFDAMHDQNPFQTQNAAASSSKPALPTHPRQQKQSSSARPRRPKFQRDTAPVLSSIASLKAEANATFKLGQFGNAEALYTRAIDALGKSSSNSIYYVLLLNNRANARMKIGDVSGAVKDCESVVGLLTTNQIKLSNEFDALGGGNKSSTEEELKIDWEPMHDHGDGKLQISISGAASEEMVDLGEGLIKAIKRRAEAYEGMEKWVKAKKDWEWLRSTAWVRDNVRSEAGRGVGRCVRMTGGGGDTTGLGGISGGSSSSLPNSRPPTSAPRPKPKPKPTTPANTKPSEALQALRSSTAQAEAEDQAKHELKDIVDARLSTWKSGKETNIRALLASLDLVLWEELLNSGGSSVKVGMHEVVTPAQVKVKYMKAVARVHPDKLNVNNSTLEQRMIAQGVFGALNEAWNAFKQ